MPSRRVTFLSLAFVLLAPASAFAQMTAAPMAPQITGVSIQRLQILRARLGAVKLRPIERAGRDLRVALARALDAAAAGGGRFDPAHPPAAVDAALRAYVTEYVRGSGETSAERLVEDASALASQIARDDVADLSRRLQDAQNAKRALRDEVTALREMLGPASSQRYPVDRRTLSVRVGADQTVRVDTVVRHLQSREEAESLLDELVRAMEEVGALTEVMQIDLAQQMHEMQSVVQLLMAIMREAHDTAMSIISNMRG